MKTNGLISERLNTYRRRLWRSPVVLALATLLACLLVVTANPVMPTASAQSSVWSLGGEAAVAPSESPHSVAFRLKSECPEPGGIPGCLEEDRLTRSGIVFMPPGNQKMMFADLSQLSTDYNPTTTDCGAGSPRFEIGLDLNGDGFPEGNLFIYIGPLYNFTNCLRGWQNTGNMIADISSEQRYDLTQFGGPFYGTYFDALSRVGNGVICYILLVVDSGWWPNLQPVAGRQIIDVDSVRINQFTLDATNPPSAKRKIELLAPDESSMPSIEVGQRGGPPMRIRLGRSFGVWGIQ